MQRTNAVLSGLELALDTLGRWLRHGETHESNTADTAWLGWDAWVSITGTGRRRR